MGRLQGYLPEVLPLAALRRIICGMEVFGNAGNQATMQYDEWYHNKASRLSY